MFHVGAGPVLARLNSHICYNLIMGAVRKSRQRTRRKAKAIIIAAVILIPFLGLAVVVTIGAVQFNQTKQVRWAFGKVDLAAERYTVEFEGKPAPNIQALLDTGFLDEMPLSPVDGRPMHIMQPGSTDFVGGMSYFLINMNSPDGSTEAYDEMILVYYHTEPQLSECIWSWLADSFIKKKSFDDHPLYRYNIDRLFSAEPELIWSGGMSGDHYVFMARGLTPEQVRELIPEVMDAELADAGYTFSLVCTR